MSIGWVPHLATSQKIIFLLLKTSSFFQIVPDNLLHFKSSSSRVSYSMTCNAWWDSRALEIACYEREHFDICCFREVIVPNTLSKCLKTPSKNRGIRALELHAWHSNMLCHPGIVRLQPAFYLTERRYMKRSGSVCGAGRRIKPSVFCESAQIRSQWKLTSLDWRIYIVSDVNCSLLAAMMTNL